MFKDFKFRMVGFCTFPNTTITPPNNNICDHVFASLIIIIERCQVRIKRAKCPTQNIIYIHIKHPSNTSIYKVATNYFQY